MKLLIIQPWFTAIGHPAQSLINTASAIGCNERVDYLVSNNCESEFTQDSIEKLRAWGSVESYRVTTSVGDSNTVRALLALGRMWLMGLRYQRIFFFDESLYKLALLWPLFAMWLPVERIGVLHLFGPNVCGGRKSRWERFVICRFLKRREVRFYLRTEELAAAWRDAYRSVESGHICYLPSLEIPADETYLKPKTPSDIQSFGIIGQVRPGKSIEWLVPAFQNEPDLGKLTVAGEFNVPETRDQLSVLCDFPGFINSFMTEADMLVRAAEQDYLLMLYDQWDRRMESAVLYLAARVNRPVIVYGDSWCGRMAKEFGCGLIAPNDRQAVIAFLRTIPKSGSDEYASLLNGMSKFRAAHSVESLRPILIQELLD